MTQKFIRLLTGVALMLAMAKLGRAATFTVNSLGDNYDAVCDAECTIREAVNLAGNDPTGTHQIDLPAGTMTLTQPANVADEVNTGDLDVVASMVISGAGIDQTIIDAADLDRVFEIDTYNTGNLDVTLRDLTIRNGKSDVFGGGLFIRTTTNVVHLERVRVTGNETTKYGGSAVYLEGGTLQISDSEIDHNSAAGNGAIAALNGSMLTLAHVHLHDNQSTSQGGALWTDGAFAMTDSTFNANTAGIGGAMALGCGAGTISNSIFVGNTATNSGGGAILEICYEADVPGQITIQDSLFYQNTSTKGNGGAIVKMSATPALLLDGVLLLDNHSLMTGGGVANVTLGTLTITGSTFSNSANSGAVDIVGNTISGGGNIFATEPDSAVLGSDWAPQPSDQVAVDVAIDVPTGTLGTDSDFAVPVTVTPDPPAPIDPPVPTEPTDGADATPSDAAPPTDTGTSPSAGESSDGDAVPATDAGETTETSADDAAATAAESGATESDAGAAASGGGGCSLLE